MKDEKLVDDAVLVAHPSRKTKDLERVAIDSWKKYR